MKRIFYPFLCLLLFPPVIKTSAQDANGCNMHWAGNTLALNNTEGGIYYDIQFSKCTSSGICGWPKVALYHTFNSNASISLTLRGLNCDNETTTSSFSTSAKEIAPQSRYEAQGNWHTFKQINQVVKVEVGYHKGSDYYQVIYDRDKGINETRINGKSIAAYNAEKQQEQISNASKTSGNNTSGTTSSSAVTSSYSNSNTSSSTSSNRSYNNSYSSSSTRSSTASNSAAVQRQAILDNLNTQLQNNRNTSNAITNSLQEFGNILQQNQAKKQAQREAARQQREEEQQEREVEREREREESERRIAQQAQIDEENRVKAENEEKAKTAQWNFDKQIIGNNLVLNKKPSLIPDQVSQVFYISYQRDYNTGEVTLKTYTLNKYSDNTWMLFSDLLNKIGFQLYFQNSGVGQLLGFYTGKDEATAILNRIIASAKVKSVDDSFLPVTPATTIIASVNSNNDEAQSLQDKGYSLDSAGNYAEAMKYYQKAADLGNLWAQNNIGVLYEYGNGIKQNYAEAFKWYQKAADKGLALAQRNLGSLYENGTGVKLNYTAAIKWYQKAADQGDDVAQYNLGSLYQGRYADANQPGLPANYTEAMNWFRKAAAQGNTDAMNAIGELYESASGVQQDYNEAVAWFKKAALQELVAAQIHLGFIYANGWDEQHRFVPAKTAADTVSSTETLSIDTTKVAADTVAGVYIPVTGVPRDYSEAMKWYRMAAAQNDYLAMINIGALYESGLGVTQNANEAGGWYAKAENTGGANAIQGIATMYASGYYGNKPNYATAVKWYRKLANEKDHWTGLIALGWIYYKGQGVTKDSAETEKWYKKAAEYGGGDAMSAAGYSYYYDYPSPDYRKAFKWFYQAATHGHMNTFYILATMYEKGQGTKVNMEEAVKWYQKAAAFGFEPAKEDLKRLGKPEKTVTAKKL